MVVLPECHFVIVTVVPRPAFVTTANSSMSRLRAGQAQAEPLVRAVPVLHRPLQVHDARPGVTRDDTHAAPMLVLDLLDHELADAGEPDDVASDLRDGGGEHGQLGAREPGLGGDLPGGLTSGDDVGIGADRDPDLARTLVIELQQRPTDPRAEVALEQVHLGIRLTLPPPVADREGNQHGAAAVGRRLVLQRQEVLRPQPRAKSVDPGRQGADSGSPLPGERGKAFTVRLVGQQQMPLLLGELLEGTGHRRLVLAGQQLLLRCFSAGRSVQAVPVAPLAGVVAPHRRHQVARRADRVRLEHAVLDAILMLEHPGQRLLHEVLSVGIVGDPRTDHSPQDRQQRVEVHRHCACALLDSAPRPGTRTRRAWSRPTSHPGGLTCGAGGRHSGGELVVVAKRIAPVPPDGRAYAIRPGA